MENNKKPNPFESKAFKIPISTEPKIIEIEKSIEKQNLEKENDEGLAQQKTLAIKMSPTLHQKYKILCATEGTTMQDDAFAFIKKRVKKSEEKNK